MCTRWEGGGKVMQHRMIAKIHPDGVIETEHVPVPNVEFFLVNTYVSFNHRLHQEQPAATISQSGPIDALDSPTYIGKTPCVGCAVETHGSYLERVIFLQYPCQLPRVSNTNGMQLLHQVHSGEPIQ